MLKVRFKLINQENPKPKTTEIKTSTTDSTLKLTLGTFNETNGVNGNPTFYGQPFPNSQQTNKSALN